jgi:hypothetical protein
MSEFGLGGSTPQVNHGGETTGQKRLFYSVRDIALIKGKQILAGYDVLKAGQMMAVEPISGDLVPYVPTTTPLHKEKVAGNAFSVADIASGATVIFVAKGEGQKFVVGQSIILVNDNAGTPVLHDGGAITAVDVTTHSHMDKITFTTATAVATFTVARFTNAYVKTNTTTPFSKAVYLLDKDVDTGFGAGADGAQTSVVISNAIVYTASLIDMDAAAIAAMGAVTDGIHTILK